MGVWNEKMRATTLPPASFFIVESSISLSVIISRNKYMASETRNSTKNAPEMVVEGGSIIDTNHKGLPVLPVRDTVLFPHAVLPLTVGRESSIQLINSLGEEKTILVVAQREARVDTPQPTDLYNLGTLATVHKVVKMPNQSLFVFTEGLQRAKLQ